MSLRGRPNIQKLVRKQNVARLIRALDDKDPSVSCAAANGLAHIVDARLGSRTHDADAVAGLIRAVNHKDAGVRRAAASGLGKIGGRNPGAADALAGALGDDQLSVRVTAALALARLGDARAVQPLSEALAEWSKSSPMILFHGSYAQDAAAALGGMQLAAATDALFAALDDPARQSAALPVLAGKARQVAPRLLPLLAARPELRSKLAGDSSLEIMIGAAPEILVSLLRDGNADIRSEALQIAEAGSGLKAVEQAVLAKIPGLERRGDVDTLLKLATYEFVQDFRARLVAALGKTGCDHRAADAVAYQLSIAAVGEERGDPWPEVVAAAVEALPAITARTAGLSVSSEGRADLVRALSLCVSPKVEERTAVMLADIGDAVAVDILLEAARDSRARRAIEPALSRVMDLDLLAAGLRSHDPGVRDMTAAALQARGTTAVEPLLRIFNEDLFGAAPSPPRSWVSSETPGQSTRSPLP